MRKDFDKNGSNILKNDLLKYNPRKWGLNRPFIDYTLRVQDFVPALSGVIGKVALVAAFAVSWRAGLGIENDSFVMENVRLELVFAGLLALIFCAFINPYAGPPGTLTPLIPMIPIMAADGIHPLSFGILVGIIGILLSAFRAFSKVCSINGTGTKGGLIILFGILGIKGAMESFSAWSAIEDAGLIMTAVIISGLLIYIILGKLNLSWLVIPVCAVMAVTVSGVLGKTPVFVTEPGLPIVNPSLWWNDMWRTGFGFEISTYLRAIPYALFAVVLWPLDALAVKAIQDENYPPEGENAKFDMDSTYTIVSFRTLIGSFLGGSQTAAIWRSFMIPLSIIRRPIGASAFLLGVFSITAGFIGYPIDIAVFPPLLWSVLIFGVFLPMLEVGMSTVNTRAHSRIAGVCIAGGILINPLLGWVFSTVLEKFMFRDKSVEKN